MKHVYPKAAGRMLRWAFMLFMQAIILSTISCHTISTEQKNDQESGAQKLQKKLVEARRREKTLQREIVVAQKPEPYLVLNLASLDVELKAKGRILRAFKINQLKRRTGNIPDDAQIVSEVRALQKVERPKLKPGEGEAVTNEAAEKNLWGLSRMAMDYDLICQNGMVLEFRALPPEPTGRGPIRFIKTLYRKIADWRRHQTSSNQGRFEAIQLWLDENDSRLLFWSLPRRLRILVIASCSQPGSRRDGYDPSSSEGCLFSLSTLSTVC
jgi:hypothetical protein